MLQALTFDNGSIAACDAHHTAVDDNRVLRVDPNGLAGSEQRHLAAVKTKLDLRIFHDTGEVHIEGVDVVGVTLLLEIAGQRSAALVNLGASAVDHPLEVNRL